MGRPAPAATAAPTQARCTGCGAGNGQRGIRRFPPGDQLRHLRYAFVEFVRNASIRHLLTKVMLVNAHIARAHSGLGSQGVPLFALILYARQAGQSY